ncbi:hypothetical protein B0H14DRAFT_2363648 [Mycena olivaceomarginata]|nr:hypothetical protein B0H14DRAFT_2363648 [Mycena olivaceomarginata]
MPNYSRTATLPASAPRPRSEERPPQTQAPTEVRKEFPQVSHPTETHDTDVFSSTSQAQLRSPRPWRRSTPKKPTGLASAIVASGLAMANSPMTAPRQSNLTSQMMNRSAPSLVMSRSQSSLTTNPNGSRRSSRAKTEHRRQRATTPANVGEGRFSDEQGGYYSGLEDSSADGSGNESGDDSGIGLDDRGEDELPVTGFAVASNKRNAEFHVLFPDIPEEDYLIDDYSCAMQKEILIHGRIYVSENHLCFHANIFTWITNLSIDFSEITTLEKRMTAFVIPNAIRIKTPRADYTFASFLARDTTFDVIHNVWRVARPGGADIVASGSRAKNGVNIAADTVAPDAPGMPAHKATTCTCGKEGSHFSKIALDTVVPGTPDRIYNLMFASGFMTDFLTVNQKLLDLQVSEWAPTTPGSALLARNVSYIKPLYASIGPKQTKCLSRDETLHLDFDDYASTLTTTRTPDVPSGGAFSVKTKTCIMWASSSATKIVVSTQVDWTGWSAFKGIIDKSAIEGQKGYHADLEKAMREYISAHQTEFVPAGVEVVLPDPTPDADPASAGVIGGSLTAKHAEDERGQRGTRWASDLLGGAAQIAKQSVKGVLQLIRRGPPSRSILYSVIIVLLISNVWTYMRAGKTVRSRPRPRRRAWAENKEQFVAERIRIIHENLEEIESLNSVV